MLMIAGKLTLQILPSAIIYIACNFLFYQADMSQNQKQLKLEKKKKEVKSKTTNTRKLNEWPKLQVA